jgi:hypothetical protein
VLHRSFAFFLSAEGSSMSDTLNFSSTSPRLGLPLLYAGQAQKEAFVNEAHARLDACVHCTIEGVAATPPASPADGSNWLVAPSASGDWTGQDGRLAARQAGNWLFFDAFDGLRIFNRATGQFSHYAGAWQVPAAVSLSQDGTTIDIQARAVLANLVSALQTAGVLPSSSQANSD